MSDMSGAGLAQLVKEIKLASENIKSADDANRHRLDSIEASVNELFKRTGRPGGYADFSDTAERKDAAEMVIAKHSLTSPDSKPRNISRVVSRSTKPRWPCTGCGS